MSSTNNDRQTAGELVPVKFSRLARRGVLLGLSLTQLITLAIAEPPSSARSTPEAGCSSPIRPRSGYLPPH